jgi:hypothetical protein
MAEHDRVTDPEFQEMFLRAAARGQAAAEAEPRAAAARYDSDACKLVIELRNGATLLIPIDLIEGLAGASPETLSEVEIEGGGYGLHWESLDADFSVPGLVAGVFGTKHWMENLKAQRVANAQQGGRSRTPAKARAARENGKKGGRPRKAAAKG